VWAFPVKYKLALRDVMKYYSSVFTLWLIIVFSTNIFAQSTIQDSSNHSIQLFLVDDVSIAYMYNFSGVFSFRVSTNISGFFKDRKTEVREYNSNNGQLSQTIIQTNKTSEQEFTLFTNFFYRFPFPKLTLYAGIGPLFGINVKTSDWSIERYVDDGYNIDRSSDTDKYFLAGGSIVLGIEVSIINNIMLLAEYEASAAYHWSNFEAERTNSDGVKIPYESEENFWEYKLNSIKLGFGIYL
jgi:hypothetical protein